jgi:hypothetical protein
MKPHIVAFAFVEEKIKRGKVNCNDFTVFVMCHLSLNTKCRRYSYFETRINRVPTVRTRDNDIYPDALFVPVAIEQTMSLEVPDTSQHTSVSINQCLCRL